MPTYQSANKIYNIDRIENAQFLVKSSEYQELLQQIEQQEKLLQYIPETKKSERLEASQKLNRLKEQLEQFKQEVLSLAETFSRIEINTERLRLAKENFDNGEFKQADAILRGEELSQELETAIREEERGRTILEKAQQKREQLSNEFLIKARVTAVLFDKPDRFTATCGYFKQAIKSARTPDSLFEYALFLQNHNQYDTARPIYEELYTIYERLAKTNPETYEPDVSMTLNNLANLYYAKNDFPAAETAYKKALEIYERLAQKIPQWFELDLCRTLIAFGIYKLQTNDIKNGINQILRAGEIAEKYNEIPFAQQILNVAKQIMNDVIENK